MLFEKKGLFSFIYEVFIVFIGVMLAFSIGNWNEDRKDIEWQKKTLYEMKNSLESDLADVRDNKNGHKMGINASNYFRRFLNGNVENTDSLNFYYLNLLRGIVSIQNRSAFESIKNKGFDVIKTDSLRLQILKLYDYNFQIIEKVQEDYSEMQFYTLYHKDFDRILFGFLSTQNKDFNISIKNIDKLNFSDKTLLINYLGRIALNRSFLLHYYEITEKDIQRLINSINNELQVL